MVYRQEFDSLLAIVAPAAILGPILVIVAASDLVAGLVAAPVLLLLVFATYTACVRAAGLVLRSLSPDAPRSFLEALQRTPDLVMTFAAPGAALLLGSDAALISIHEGFGPIGLLVLLLAVAAAVEWATRHAYDLPLVLGFDMTGPQAVEVGPATALDARERTLTLLGILSAPLIAVAALSLALGLFFAPLLGAALFVLALAFWLPFPAVCLTLDCVELQREPASA